MPTLFESNTVTGVRGRIQGLKPGQQRQWGKMTLPQALAHCSLALEMAVGDRRPPRLMIGRVLGPIFKRVVIGNESPMRPNSPTAPDLIVSDSHEFEPERTRLAGLLDRFSAGGAAKCTTHPHPFFGSLTPNQWAELQYKHLDHHLRQFGA